jgi:hypothetical protein
MSSAKWFDANMFALFGAALYDSRDKHHLKLTGINKPLHSLLQRNGFLENFGFTGGKVPDYKGTTIEYQRFDKTDSDAFKKYVERHFVGKGIPDMSQALHKKFRESIAELFDNAVEHSKTTKGIFACGQYFPNDCRLDFSIVDLGMGMKNVINTSKEKNLGPVEAIEWAMSGKNTTRRRRDKKPGGLGLKLIKEFIALNGGKIQIVSDAGYWSYKNTGIETDTFSLPFNGTVVNIEINTADTQSYCLESELSPDDIF